MIHVQLFILGFSFSVDNNLQQATQDEHELHDRRKKA
jgi:hypothetical protein